MRMHYKRPTLLFTLKAEKRIEHVMKIQMKHTIWFLTLLPLLSAPHMASAYYDAGVQRWINRDPLREPGFELIRLRNALVGGASVLRASAANTYLFCRNDPEDLRDAFGLDAYGDCIQGCKDKLIQRYHDTDTCSKWAFWTSASAGGAGGAYYGGLRGRGISGFLIGLISGPANYVLVQIAGNIYSDAIWVNCITKCYYLYAMHSTDPVYFSF